jgi:hypothetical protein
MPRPKHGLGQGLEALVAPRHRPSGWPEPGILSRQDEPADDTARWEYARLQAAKRKGKRRLLLTISHPDPSLKPRTRHIRGVDSWTALGMLGVDGWELVSAGSRRYLFKRPVSAG